MIEPLESRTLFAVTWAPYAKLVEQDKAAADFPNLDGAGETIAMIDTGIDYNQPALGGGFGPGFKVEAGYDFEDNDSDPMDESGHGTNTAAVVAADPYTVDGVTYQGVAPDAKLIALRVGTDDNIPDSNIGEALQWVIDHQSQYNINVVNLSLGSGNYTSAQTQDDLSPYFKTLAGMGVFVVAASGNSQDQNSGPISQDGIAFPAADPNVFAVGAVDSNDVITTWSQRGSELDLLAPGVNIVMPKMGGGFVTEDGTSFASPYVAGAAALIKEEDPTAMAGDIGSILMSSGVNNRDGDKETGNTTGLLFSRLDIDDALSLTEQRVGKTDSLSLGKTFSTTLDSEGVLHAAFYDTRHGNLDYATRDTSGKWSAVQVIDSGGDVGAQMSIAVDSTGKVGIGYYDVTNTAVKYASFDGTSWSDLTVDSDKNVGSSPSLAFTIDGDAYLAYYRKSGGYLRLAHLERDSGKWVRSTVDGGTDGNVGADVSLDIGEAAVGGNGIFTTYDTTVAMAYADTTNGNLKYARLDVDNPSATWFMSVIDDTTGVGNISFKLHDGPLGLGTQAQMAFLDGTTHQVEYAYRDNNEWFLEPIVTGSQNGASIQLAFNASNTPLVSYYNSSAKATYTGTRGSDGTWSSQRTVASAQYISVASNNRDDDVFLSVLDRDKTAVSATELV